MTKNISFIVDMTEAMTNATARTYRKYIVNLAEDLGLKVSTTGVTAKRGMEFAGLGNFLSVGTVFDKTGVDVEWIERLGYVCEKKYKPVYDIVDDIETIVSKLREYAANKEIRYFTSNGDVAKISIGSDIVVINNKIHLRKRDLEDLSTLLG